MSWAHGTSGIGDACAPSVVGPALPERDWPYLGNWMREGYAIVASDYVGLGTPGLQAYLHGRSRRTTSSTWSRRAGASHRRPRKAQSAFRAAGSRSANRRAAAAAIYTARYATEFGGPKLDYRGAVGTGTPANIERQLPLSARQVPPVALTPGITAYVSYIFAGLRYVHPELGIDGILTPDRS